MSWTKPCGLKKLGISFIDLNGKKDCGIYAALSVFLGESKETPFFSGSLSTGTEQAGGKAGTSEEKNLPALVSVLAGQQSFVRAICHM